MIKKPSRKSVREKPQFELIPEEKWVKLSKKDRDVLRKYRSHYRWVKDWGEQIDQKKKEIKRLQDRINRKLYDMNKLNTDIDHIRDTYEFSMSFITRNRWTNSKGETIRYWGVCVTFRTGEGKKTRMFDLGNRKKITDHMLSYFKSNPFMNKNFDNWKKKISTKKKFFDFMVKECKEGEIYHICLDKCLENPKGFREGSDDTKLTLSDFYPIPTK